MPATKHPTLVYKVKQNPWPLPTIRDATTDSIWRVQVRAAEGLQKEAVVYSQTGTAWRMLSDEGVQLGGDELAPCPLEFFTAGMLFSYMLEILNHAKAQNIEIESLKILQDNYYSINGSALRGNMLGAAQPAQVMVKLEADAPEKTIRRLLRLAYATSPAHALMRNVLVNTFSLKYNGQPLPLTQVQQSPRKPRANPLEQFHAIQPSLSTDFLPNIVTQTETDEETFCKEREELETVQIEQRGTIYVHGQAEALEGALMEAVVQQCKPVVSAFRFLCGEGLAGGTEVAPPPLAYLLVGAATCYITQLMRYAHLTKQKFSAMSTFQENSFTSRGTAADGSLEVTANPVDTHVFMQTEEAEAVAQKTVSMAERMCFIHAAMRGSHPSTIQAQLNGLPLPLQEESA